LLEQPELSEWLIQREPNHCIYWKKYIQVVKQEQHKQRQRQLSSTTMTSTKATASRHTSPLFVAIRLGYSWSPVLKDIIEVFDGINVLNIMDDSTGLPAFALAATATTNHEQQLHPFNARVGSRNNNNGDSSVDDDIVEAFLKDLVGDWLTIDEISGITTTTTNKPQHGSQKQGRNDPIVIITKCDKCCTYLYKGGNSTIDDCIIDDLRVLNTTYELLKANPSILGRIK
jgi:hypothetical protein